MLEKRGKVGRRWGSGGGGRDGGRCARGISSRQLKKGRVDGKLISRTKLQAGVDDIHCHSDYAVGPEKNSLLTIFFFFDDAQTAVSL